MNILWKDFNSFFVHERVYNVWAEAISFSFWKHNNPIKSVKGYLHGRSTLKFLCTQAKHNGVRFATVLDEKILTSWRVNEELIDATFKTNKQKLDLCVIIASCMGVGFSMSYFSLETGTGTGFKSREEFISFFCKVWRAFMQVCSLIFIATKKLFS